MNTTIQSNFKNVIIALLFTALYFSVFSQDNSGIDHFAVDRFGRNYTIDEITIPEYLPVSGQPGQTSSAPPPCTAGWFNLVFTDPIGVGFNDPVEGLMDPALQEKSRRNFDPRKPKFSTDPSLHVYPNPTDDYLILEFKNWEGPCDLTLFDAKGSIAMQQTLESSRSAQVVNTSALVQGTYELRLISRSDPELNESLRIEISH